MKYIAAICNNSMAMAMNMHIAMTTMVFEVKEEYQS